MARERHARRVFGLLETTSGTGGLEPVAPADRRHLQVERRMLGVPAVIHEIFRGLVLHPDLRQLLVVVVIFAKMCTQSALAFLNGLHGEPPMQGFLGYRYTADYSNGSGGRPLENHDLRK
jgi:hypothetical protein